MAKKKPLTADDPRHGTANGYNNLGCRCESCREAWRVYHGGGGYLARYRDRLTSAGFQRGYPSVPLTGKHPYGPDKSLRPDPTEGQQ